MLIFRFYDQLKFLLKALRSLHNYLVYSNTALFYNRLPSIKAENNHEPETKRMDFNLLKYKTNFIKSAKVKVSSHVSGKGTEISPRPTDEKLK